MRHSTQGGHTSFKMGLSYLIVFDIMMQAETQDNVAFNRWMMGRMNQKGYRRQCSWPNPKCNPGISLERGKYHKCECSA
jgi:hypothetical protein